MEFEDRTKQNKWMLFGGCIRVFIGVIALFVAENIAIVVTALNE